MAVAGSADCACKGIQYKIGECLTGFHKLNFKTDGIAADSVHSSHSLTNIQQPYTPVTAVWKLDAVNFVLDEGKKRQSAVKTPLIGFQSLQLR